MNYSYLAFGDVHWGAQNLETTTQNLSYLIEYIRDSEPFDLIVLCGDYFDKRLQLGSSTAIAALDWFKLFYDTVKESGCPALRIIRGTLGHDNEQLNVIKAMYEDSSGFCKVFDITTLEETLPGLNVLYGPDENITNDDWYSNNQYLLDQKPHIGFFHGNFDKVIPSILRDNIDKLRIPTVVYEVDTLAQYISGPLISSHWHDAVTVEPLFYIGSYDRWAFNEEGDKGFLIGDVDSDSRDWTVTRVVNPLANIFTTVKFTPADIRSDLQFDEFNSDLKNTLEDATALGANVRIYFEYDEEDKEALNKFEAMKRAYESRQGVKLTIKNKVEKALKKKAREKVEEETSTHEYLLKNPNKYAENISEFIKHNMNEDVSVEIVNSIIGKYLQ